MALCLSLIPLQEGLGLRTYSPLLESLFTNYCLKVVPQKFIRADSSPLPRTPPRLSLPKSLTYMLPPVVLSLPLETLSPSPLSAVFVVQSAVTVVSSTSCYGLKTGGSIAGALSTAAVRASVGFVQSPPSSPPVP